MRFRPLSRDPFTDIGRSFPEFRSIGLAESEEVHGFSVDKNNVFEIDGEAPASWAFTQSCSFTHGTTDTFPGGSPVSLDCASVSIFQFCARCRCTTTPDRCRP